MTARPDGVGVDVLFDVVEDHIAVVTLNRPDKRNAINESLARALQWVRRAIDRDAAIRVAILTSSLDGVFCAGADLAEIAAGRGAALAPDGEGLAGFTSAPRETPWIAALRGKVLGGGLELALACDLIVAADDAVLGLPEVQRGLFAAAGGPIRLPRLLPRNVAMEMIATGNPLPAARAFDFGLVNRLVPSARVPDEALALAREIATVAPLAVRQSLRLARMAHDRSEAELHVLSRECGAVVFRSDDAREGPRAFLEKRRPVWSGR